MIFEQEVRRQKSEFRIDWLGIGTGNQSLTTFSTILLGEYTKLDFCQKLACKLVADAK